MAYYNGHVIHTPPPLNELPFSPPPPWPRPQRTINTEKRKFMMDYTLTLADNGIKVIPDFLDAIETLYNEIVKRSQIDQPKKHEEKAEEENSAL